MKKRNPRSKPSLPKRKSSKGREDFSISRKTPTASEALISHAIPGRLRIKIPLKKGDESYFADLSDRLSNCPGLKVPYKILFPSILLFCLIGAYSVSNSVFDVYMMILFGVFGYLMKKFEFEGAPLILAFVLSPLLENNLRKALILSQGDFSTFVTRPISLVCLLIAAFVLLSPFIPSLRKKREEIALEEAS